MGKIFQQLTLLSGLVLYLLDYGSDIYVAYRYWQNGDVWWFGLTVGFIVGPSIILNITAIIQLIDCWTCLAGVLQLSFIIRYFEAIKSPTKDRVYFLTKLHYLETIVESAPQCCLQGYILLQEWKFPAYTVVSIFLSFLSLAWSIISLEKARHEQESKEFKLCQGFLFSVTQLCSLIPRLTAIVISVYAFSYYAFIFIGIQRVILTLVVFKLQEHHTTASFILSLLASFPYLFHASRTVIPIEKPRNVLLIGYIIIVPETVVMVTLSLTIKMLDASHVDLLKPVVIGLTAGGLFSATICFWCFYYSHDDDDGDGDDNDVDNQKLQIFSDL